MGWTFPWSAGPPLPPQGPGDRRRGDRRRGDRREQDRRQEANRPAEPAAGQESDRRGQDRRSGADQRQFPRHALVGAALNVTVLIWHQGQRLAPGSIWDLSHGGVCVWVPGQPHLTSGEQVELELITAQDASSIRLPATLCWTKTCDGQWFVGFQFAPPGLPQDCSLHRLLERSSRPSAQRQG